MLLLIDNYDSFTYNLYQQIGEYEKDIKVFRNDKIDRKKVRKLNPTRIVISPGPKTPDDAGNCMDIIDEFYKEIPMLGICLGHQCIGQYFKSKIIHAPTPCHGKYSMITHSGIGLFQGITNPLKVARYHSLIIKNENLSDELIVTSETEDEIIMSIQHKNFPVFGLQFHPESIITESGHKIIENFLKVGVRND